MTSQVDKIIIITGAAGALGSSVAKIFDSNDNKLVLLDLEENKLNSLREKLNTQSLVFGADLTDESHVRKIISKVISQFGRIDVLCNIAGGFQMNDRTHNMDINLFDQMINMNSKSMLTISKYVLKSMVDQQYGKIINIGARAGLEGKANMGPYCASKAMVIRLTEAMAHEYKDDGININCILPGTLDTPRNRKEMPNQDFSNWVDTENMARVIKFLASDEASEVKGAKIPVYGNTL